MRKPIALLGLILFVPACFGPKFETGQCIVQKNDKQALFKVAGFDGERGEYLLYAPGFENPKEWSSTPVAVTKKTVEEIYLVVGCP